MLKPQHLLVLICLLLTWNTPAYADFIGVVLTPGKVIEGHAKFESDCSKCHKKFDKPAQPLLCNDCHKDIAKDLNEMRGYHGGLKDTKECNVCHTDHKGRDAKIVIFETDKFDHIQTRFQLKGGHLGDKIKCKDCHLPAKKFREAPSSCNACHKKDDTHKGGLGSDCASCHEEKDWKTTRFDHDKTDFKLLGKHSDVKCKECHIDEKFKDTAKQCSSCHKKDDKHKGNFGLKCESCHVEKNWKTIIFDHSKQTDYPLLGQHSVAKCSSCHKGNILKEKLQTSCLSCHKKEDKHKGNFGPKCESCHLEKGWKTILFDHSKQTKYPLLDKHKEVKCVSCHKGDVFKDKLQTKCITCHEKDDKHKGQLSNKCDSCHNEQSWTKAKFNHNQSTFPLLGKHFLVDCKKCHMAVTFKDAKSDCLSCHEKEDVHKQRLGTTCSSCHNARNWKAWDFDHNKTLFKLEGKHGQLGCYECHKQPVNKPSPNKQLSLASDCYSCHRADDVHNTEYGQLCARCHTATAWKKIIVNGRLISGAKLP